MDPTESCRTQRFKTYPTSKPEKVENHPLRRKRFGPPVTQDHFPAAVQKSEESGRYRLPMSQASWQEALKALKEALKHLDQQKVQNSANRITWGIECLDPIMSRYCQLTCPTCKDACCTGHEVFFNQTDLLYLTALGIKIPPGQTRSSTTQTCRYLGEKGCRLSRFHRPYVCVWFLCEAQMEIFRQEPNAFQRHFIETMQNIRMHRLTLECLFENHSPRD